MTWIKNAMCAILIALSPFTSGSAVLKVASEVGSGPWGGLKVLAVPSLWRLVAMLFFGVSGREVMMDITDLQDDKQNQVRRCSDMSSLASVLCSLPFSRFLALSTGTDDTS